MIEYSVEERALYRRGDIGEGAAVLAVDAEGSRPPESAVRLITKASRAHGTVTND